MKIKLTEAGINRPLQPAAATLVAIIHGNLAHQTPVGNGLELIGALLQRRAVKAFRVP
jgi:hypothetical protein